MSQQVWLDANVLLRFLRKDHPTHSPLAARLFQKASLGEVKLYISAVTISEVFYAYTTFYKLTPAQTAKEIIPFFRTGFAELEDFDCLLDALNKVSEENVDFGDAYLAAGAVKAGVRVASFDKHLKRFKDVELYDFEGEV